jgi:hypothetical protein
MKRGASEFAALSDPSQQERLKSPWPSRRTTSKSRLGPTISLAGLAARTQHLRSSAGVKHPDQLHFRDPLGQYLRRSSVGRWICACSASMLVSAMVTVDAVATVNIFEVARGRPERRHAPWRRHLRRYPAGSPPALSCLSRSLFLLVARQRLRPLWWPCLLREYSGFIPSVYR